MTTWSFRKTSVGSLPGLMISLLMGFNYICRVRLGFSPEEQASDPEKRVVVAPISSLASVALRLVV